MVYKTYWTINGAPYGYYDDYVIFEVDNGQFQMLDGEFNFIFHQLYDNYWKKKTCKYIQIIKEWNELIGFNDVDEVPSVILDIQDTIQAFYLLKGIQDNSFPGLKQFDLDNLNAFLVKNQNNEIKILKK